LNPKFGTGGVVTTNFGNNDFASSILTEPDGKIVVVGTDTPNTFGAGQIALARYERDGSLDESFGSGGKVLTLIGASDFAGGAVIRPDGKIIVDAAEVINPTTFQTENLLVQYNRDGTIDTSFGNGGSVVTSNLVPSHQGNGITLSPQGQIVVVGSSPSFSSMEVAEFNPDGSLNAGFGSGGIASVSSVQGTPTNNVPIGEFFPSGGAVTVDSEGRVLVAGAATPLGVPAGPQAALYRFNPDGTLDKSFGTKGSITSVFGITSFLADAVLVRPNGQIVVAGNAGDPANPGNLVFAVEQYNPDGTPDLKFGFDGLVGTRIPNTALDISVRVSMAIQRNDDVVVVGNTLTPNTFVGGFAMARYTPDGNLDPSFGSSGLVTIFPGNSVVGVAETPDGNLVVAGSSGDPVTGKEDFVVAEYLGRQGNPGFVPPPSPPTGPQSPSGASGQLDPAFGTGGVVTTSFGGNEFETSMATQPDGKIVVVGNEFGPNFAGPLEIIVARYNRDGSLDQSFGSGGSVFTLVGANDFFGSVAIGRDGKIVVAGVETDSTTNLTNILLVEYNSDGSLDQSFGSGGIVTTSLPNGQNFLFGPPPFGDSQGNALAITRDGRIVVVGSSSGGTAANGLVVAEYDRHGQLEQDFGTGGLVVTPSFTDSAGNTFTGPAALAVTVDQRGRIVVGATALDPSNGFSPIAVVARYKANGDLDFGFGFQGAVTSVFDGPSTNVFVPGGISANAVAIGNDGEIIVAGNAALPGFLRAYFTSSSFAVEKLEPDGSVDQTFGSDGIALYGVPYGRFGTFNATGLVLEFGRSGIVVAGNTSLFINTVFGFESINGPAIIRLRPDGTFDPSFGSGGVVTASFPNPQGFVPINLALEPDDNIVAAGTSLSSNFQFEFGLAEYFAGPPGDDPPSGFDLPSDLTPSQAAGNVAIGGAAIAPPAPAASVATPTNAPAPPTDPANSAAANLPAAGSSARTASFFTVLSAAAAHAPSNAGGNLFDGMDPNAIDAVLASIR
jgi:uncharacterized delta-60 repeat protein